MYDIEHLEQQWILYRKKRIILPIAIISVLLIVLLLLYIFWPKAQDSVLSQDSNNQPPHTNISQHSKNGHTDSQASNSLSPEVPSVSKSNSDSGEKGWNITFTDSKKSSGNEAVSTATKHIDIEVSTKKPSNSVKDVEERFASSGNQDDALFLARYYYDKKQYKSALKWALEVNKLDNGIEESWLIFSKSKAKLGSRAEAIRVLQAYYDRSGSKKAKSLLDAIRRGKAF